MYGLCMNHTENVKLVREPPVAQRRVRYFETIFQGSITHITDLSIYNIRQFDISIRTHYQFQEYKNEYKKSIDFNNFKISIYREMRYK